MSAVGEDPSREAPGSEPLPVPRALQIATAWALRLLVIGAAVWVASLLLGRIRLAVIPVISALLLAALLQPAVALLRRRGIPRLPAAWVVLLAFVAAVGGALWLVGDELAEESNDLSSRVGDGVERLRQWVLTGPLPLGQEQLDSAAAHLSETLRGSSNGGPAGVVTAAGAVAEVLSGTVLTIFVLLLFLADGARIWRWLVNLLPRAARNDAAEAGARAWATLVRYLRGLALVALADAVLIGAGLLLLGVPLALPLALLTFIAAFVPLIGATLAGLAAALVALVDGGPGTALLVLALVIVVQQIDGNVLEPLILGKAVRLHPLAIVLSITVGYLLAGIFGALVAVPATATIHTAASYLARERDGDAASAASPGSPASPG